MEIGFSKFGIEDAQAVYIIRALDPAPVICSLVPTNQVRRMHKFVLAEFTNLNSRTLIGKEKAKEQTMTPKLLSCRPKANLNSTGAVLLSLSSLEVPMDDSPGFSILPHVQPPLAT